MGKYMRKSKPATATVEEKAAALMDLSQSPLGVRTRAKTLALQRLQKSAAPALPSTPAASAGPYLQLRSRRLHKPQIPAANGESRRQNHLPKQGRGPNPNPSSIANSNSRASSRCRVSMEVEIEENENESDDLGVEASFGENVLEFEGRARSARETTPCSLIKNPEAIRTPGSTNRHNSNSLIEVNRRTVQNSTRRHFPTAQDINEFFTAAEEQHHRQFTEKYNFDPVKGTPLMGRYEWVKVNP